MVFRSLGALQICILILLLAGNLCAASPAATQLPVITKNASSPVTGLIDFVNEAVVYAQRVGKEAALKEFSLQNGSFTRGDQYIWAYDTAGVNLAHPFHPEFVGVNKLSLTDSKGFRMIEAMRDTALNGSGYVPYLYENPVTGMNEEKLAYVKRVDDTWWLASGVYGGELSIPADAPESIRDTLRATVGRAVTYAREVGKENALTEFNNLSGHFITNGTYIFAFDMNGTTLALPFLPEKIGINEGDLTDLNGVSIGGEKLMVAKDGGGFWYYVFDNPDADRRPELKVSYIRPVDETWVIGTGIYLSNIPVQFSPENRNSLVTLVHDAVAYTGDHGKEAAIREFSNPNGTFSDPKLFIFTFDLNGTLLSNPYLPGLVGMNRMGDQDPYGKYPVRQLIANALDGGGFTYYFFADPGSDYRIRLKLGYSELAGDDLIIGAGIFPDQ
ncbi:MAG TPA: cache domain-containing protein [Methanospirillum sp.]|nr:cache domain-containing protein [Methanospirillum sp.]